MSVVAVVKPSRPRAPRLTGHSRVVTAGYDGLASGWSATPAGSLQTVARMAMSRVKSGLAPNELKADLAAISG